MASKSTKTSLRNDVGDELILEADFNCPNSGKMKLEGKAKEKGKNTTYNLKVDLSKDDRPVFDDEWNDIIDNWLVGGSNPNWINEVMARENNVQTREQVVPLTDDKSAVFTATKTNNETVTELSLPIKKDVSTVAVVPEQIITQIKPKEEKPIAIVETKIETPKQPIEFLDVTKPRNSGKEINVVITDEKPLEKPKEAIIKEKTAEVAVLDEPKKPVEFLEPNKTDKPTTDIHKDTKAITTAPTPAVKVAVPIEPIITDEARLTQQLKNRKKEVTLELPIADSISFFVYDNAEVDGDSVSLFLNDTLLHKHVLLSDRAFEFKLYKEQLQGNNVTLTMLAENLGAIPPNTSYIKVLINGKSYQATLSSTEETSAVIRFKR